MMVDPQTQELTAPAAAAAATRGASSSSSRRRRRRPLSPTSAPPTWGQNVAPPPTPFYLTPRGSPKSTPSSDASTEAVVSHPDIVPHRSSSHKCGHPHHQRKVRHSRRHQQQQQMLPHYAPQPAAAAAPLVTTYAYRFPYDDDDTIYREEIPAAAYMPRPPFSSNLPAPVLRPPPNSQSSSPGHTGSSPDHVFHPTSPASPPPDDYYDEHVVNVMPTFPVARRSALKRERASGSSEQKKCVQWVSDCKRRPEEISSDRRVVKNQYSLDNEAERLKLEQESYQRQLYPSHSLSSSSCSSQRRAAHHIEHLRRIEAEIQEISGPGQALRGMQSASSLRRMQPPVPPVRSSSSLRTHEARFQQQPQQQPQQQQQQQRSGSANGHTKPRSANLEQLYHEALPPMSEVLSHSGPAIYGTGHTLARHEDTASMMSFTSSIHSLNEAAMSSLRNSSRLRQEELGGKAECLDFLASVRESTNFDKISRTLQAMSSSPANCDVMRAHRVVPFLVQLLHGTHHASPHPEPSAYPRPSRDVRQRVAHALFNMVHSRPQSKECRREAKVLRLLEALRQYADFLRDLQATGAAAAASPHRAEDRLLQVLMHAGCKPITVQMADQQQKMIICDIETASGHGRLALPSEHFVFYPHSCEEASVQIKIEETMSLLIKLTFDESHRKPICELGGIPALAELIQIEREVHGSRIFRYQGGGGLDDSVQSCFDVRRYAVVALTNLTFQNGNIKSFLCAFQGFIPVMVQQLESPSEHLLKATAHLFRNLGWKADKKSKEILRNSEVVSALLRASMEIARRIQEIPLASEPELEASRQVDKHSQTLVVLLSALWNLSAHCGKNKADICSMPGALAFLVSLLKSRHDKVVENGGGVLRNMASYIAHVQNESGEQYRQILRNEDCFSLLVDQLQGSSMTVVNNAVGTIWNLSARCTQDQLKFWDLGAVPLLRGLTQCKHKPIAKCAQAALKNLNNAKPVQQATLPNKSTASSTSSGSGAPSLEARKRRNLTLDMEHDDDDSELAEACGGDNDSPRDSEESDEDSVPQQSKHHHHQQHIDEPDEAGEQAARQPLELSKSRKQQFFVKLQVTQSQPDVIPCPSSHFTQPQQQQQPRGFYMYTRSTSPSLVNTTAIGGAGSSSQFGGERILSPSSLQTAFTTVSSDDEPRNYMLRFGEDAGDEDNNCGTAMVDEGDHEDAAADEEAGGDKIRTYCTEDTPYGGTPFVGSSSNSVSDPREAVPHLEDLEEENSEDGDEPRAYHDEDDVHDEDDEDDGVKPAPQSGFDTPAENPTAFCTEDTPAGVFSRADSISSLGSSPNPHGIDMEEARRRQEDQLRRLDEQERDQAEAAAANDNEETVVGSPRDEEAATPPLPEPTVGLLTASALRNKNHVTFNPQQTPLMYSRASSLASLNSCEQHSIRTGYSSYDVSRMTSGRVSPSELPDSPCQSRPRSPHHFKAPYTAKRKPPAPPSAARVQSSTSEKALCAARESLPADRLGAAEEATQTPTSKETSNATALLAGAAAAPLSEPEKRQQEVTATGRAAAGAAAVQQTFNHGNGLVYHDQEDLFSEPVSEPQVKTFNDEGTPAGVFSSGTSISKLTFSDDEESDVIQEKKQQALAAAALESGRIGQEVLQLPEHNQPQHPLAAAATASEERTSESAQQFGVYSESDMLKNADMGKPHKASQRPDSRSSARSDGRSSRSGIPAPNQNASFSSQLLQRRAMQFPIVSDAHSLISEPASDMEPKAFFTEDTPGHMSKADSASDISALTFDKGGDLSSSDGDEMELLKQFEQLGKPQPKAKAKSSHHLSHEARVEGEGAPAAKSTSKATRAQPKHNQSGLPKKHAAFQPQFKGGSYLMQKGAAAIPQQQQLGSPATAASSQQSEDRGRNSEEEEIYAESLLARVAELGKPQKTSKRPTSRASSSRLDSRRSRSGIPPHNQSQSASLSQLPQRRALQFPTPADSQSVVSESASDAAPRAFYTEDTPSQALKADSHANKETECLTEESEMDLLKQFAQLGKPQPKARSKQSHRETRVEAEGAPAPKPTSKPATKPNKAIPAAANSSYKQSGLPKKPSAFQPHFKGGSYLVQQGAAAAHQQQPGHRQPQPQTAHANAPEDKGRTSEEEEIYVETLMANMAELGRPSKTSKRSSVSSHTQFKPNKAKSTRPSSCSEASLSANGFVVSATSSGRDSPRRFAIEDTPVAAYSRCDSLTSLEFEDPEEAHKQGQAPFEAPRAAFNESKEDDFSASSQFKSHLPRPSAIGRSGSSGSSKAGGVSITKRTAKVPQEQDEEGSSSDDNFDDELRLATPASGFRPLPKSRSEPLNLKDKVQLRQKKTDNDDPDSRKRRSTSKSPRNSRVIPGVKITELVLAKPKSRESTPSKELEEEPQPRDNLDLPLKAKEQDVSLGSSNGMAVSEIWADESPNVTGGKSLAETVVENNSTSKPTEEKQLPEPVDFNLEETLTESTVLRLEAQRASEHVSRIAAASSSNLDDDLSMASSMCSNISAIQPPSMMESVLSMSEKKSISDNTYTLEKPPVASPRSKLECRHTLSAKKGYAVPMVVSRALGVPPSTSAENDLSNSVSSSSCQSNIDNIKPPTLMEDGAALDNSIVSIESLSSEVAGGESSPLLSRRMMASSCLNDDGIDDIEPPTAMDDVSGALTSRTLVAEPPAADGATYTIDPSGEDQSTYRDITDVFDDDTTLEPTLTLESDNADAEEAPDLPRDSRHTTPASSREHTPKTQRKATPTQQHQQQQLPKPGDFGTPVNIDYYKKFRVPVPDLDDATPPILADETTSGYKSDTTTITITNSSNNSMSPSKSSRARRKEEIDRFKTHTITKEDLVVSPQKRSPKSVKQRREEEADRFLTRTITASDLKPKRLDFGETSTLPASGAPLHPGDMLLSPLEIKFVEEDANLVAEAFASAKSAIRSRSTSVDDILERSMTGSIEILQDKDMNTLKMELSGSDPTLLDNVTASPKRVGPRICKPGQGQPQQHSPAAEPEVRGIRGRRKPLYSTPPKRSTVPPAVPPKPAVAPKPHVRGAVNSSPAAAAAAASQQPIRGTRASNLRQVRSQARNSPPSSPKLTPRSSTCSSVRSSVSSIGSGRHKSLPLVRQGTFTKEESSPNTSASEDTATAARKLPPKPTGLRKDAIHPVANHRPVGNSSNSSSTRVSPRSTDSSRSSRMPRIAQTKTSQLRERSSSRSNPSRSNLRTASSSSNSSLNSVRSGAAKPAPAVAGSVAMKPSNSSHALRPVTEKPSLGPRTVSAVANRSTAGQPAAGKKEKKAVTSKIASLWKQVEDSKKKTGLKPEHDPRKWITKGQVIPESELALLKPHTEQKELISNFQKNKLETNNQNKAAGSSHDASDVSTASSTTAKVRSRSRLSMKLSKFRSKSREKLSSMKSPTTPEIEQQAEDVMNGNLSGSSPTTRNNAMGVDAEVDELLNAALAAEDAAGEGPMDERAKRLSRLGSFFNPETDEQQQQLQQQQPAAIRFRSPNNRSPAPASAIVPPFNYNPPLPHLEGAAHLLASPTTSEANSTLSLSSRDKSAVVRRNDSYVSSMGRGGSGNAAAATATGNKSSSENRRDLAKQKSNSVLMTLV